MVSNWKKKLLAGLAGIFAEEKSIKEGYKNQYPCTFEAENRSVDIVVEIAGYTGCGFLFAKVITAGSG